MVTLTSNIISNEEFHRQVNETLTFLSNTLSKTLGPYGSTTLVQDRGLSHTISKDGYSILKEIMIAEDIPRTVLDLVQNISRSQVNNVGDGSTSSVIISDSLYKELFHNDAELDSEEMKVAPKDLINMLEVLSEILEREVKEKSKPLSSFNEEERFNILKNVASVSVNNDKDLGSFIAEVFQNITDEGYVTIKKGVSAEHTYKISDGVEANARYISDAFVNEPELGVNTLVRPKVLLMDIEVGNLEYTSIVAPLLNLCATEQVPLVILAKDYTRDVKKALIDTHKKTAGAILFSAGTISTASKDSQEVFQDLQVYLGIKNKVSYNNIETIVDIIGTGKHDEILGSCEVVSMGDNKTQFTKGFYDPEEMESRKKSIKDAIIKKEEEVSHIDFDAELGRLRNRYYKLTQSVATIEVGGINDIERETKLFLVEDAVLACQSTIKYGVLIGGNITIPHIIDSKFDSILEELKNELINRFGDTRNNNKTKYMEFVLRAVSDAFKKSYTKVLENKFGDSKGSIKEILDKCVSEYAIMDLHQDKIQKFEETPIINSVYTDLNIMKATFSIIGLLGSSNQFMSMNLVQ